MKLNAFNMVRFINGTTSSTAGASSSCVSKRTRRGLALAAGVFAVATAVEHGAVVQPVEAVKMSESRNEKPCEGGWEKARNELIEYLTRKPDQTPRDRALLNSLLGHRGADQENTWYEPSFQRMFRVPGNM